MSLSSSATRLFESSGVQKRTACIA
jgi:hypothetical protein